MVPFPCGRWIHLRVRRRKEAGGVREVLMGSVQTKAVKKRKDFMKKVGRGCGGVQFGGVVGNFVCFILVYSRFVVVAHWQR